MKCPVCGEEARFLYKWISPYSLQHCSGCETLFSDPVPGEDELNEYYQGFVYRKPDTEKLQGLIEEKKRELSRLFGDSLHEGRSFLDFGGGSGIASLAAAELGLKVVLYEIDQDAIAFVTSVKGENDLRTCSDILLLDAEAFDLILSDNVIEHVREPDRHMDLLFNFLKPSGKLIIKTPNARNAELLFHPLISIGGYLWRVYRYNNIKTAAFALGFRPWALDPPRHLFSFSARSLVLLANGAGIDDGSVEAGFYRTPLWEYSFLKLLAGAKLTDVKSIFKMMIVLFLIPFEVVLKLLECVLQRLNLISAAGVFLRITRTSSR